MGAGNFYPSNEAARYIYVDIPYDESWTECDHEWWYHDLTHNVLSCLPKSMTPVHHRKFWHEGDVIADNQLAVCYLADNQTSVAVVIDPLDEPEGLCNHWVSQVAEGVWKRLNEVGYELRVRTSAWTSGKWEAA